MNFFRLSGDLLHLLSKLILIFTIHIRGSAEGISLLTQSLYTLVFLTRYVDLLTIQWSFVYNTVFKVFYIASSLYILFLMLRVYARTREEEWEWKVSAFILLGSGVAAPVLKASFTGERDEGWFIETLWNFSIVLEAFAILPQISLLRHTKIPTAITSYYLLALGLYRALYIPNWIIRWLDPKDGFIEPVAVIFGIVQTALYVDFAWVYYRRQKIKIRENGAILDGEDFVSSGLLGWLLGGKKSNTGGRRTGGGWRGGGLSVSADEEVLVHRDSLSGDELEDEESEDDLEVEGLGPVRDVERGLIGK